MITSKKLQSIEAKIAKLQEDYAVEFTAECARQGFQSDGFYPLICQQCEEAKAREGSYRCQTCLDKPPSKGGPVLNIYQTV